ncbi:MAG: transcription-repair coupling factor, partial [Muribaculaceae bacterium]|nr:transcription-repair coupling factor [Muribaculaceae bacterium]
MQITDLCKKFYTAARRKAVEKALSTDISDNPPRFCSLSGSARSMLLAGIADSIPHAMLVIGHDREDADTLYHDMSRMLPDEAVAMFPSGYARHIKYATPDPEAQIQRTETLNRYIADKSLKVIVSYPDALAEKVMDKKEADAQTFSIKSGTSIDPETLIDWLNSHEFSRVDYVYEPGTYARRGSIVDIFGFSHELPVRIDFFGDEVDSIRTFSVETQLSERKLDTAIISINISRSGSSGISLLEFIDKEDIIAAPSLTEILSDVRSTACDTTLSTSASADIDTDTEALSQLIDYDRFSRNFESRRRFEFTAATPDETKTVSVINFHCSPQGTYNSNIQLFTDFFDRYVNAGYKAFILSDNASQLSRLKELIKDSDDIARFTPINQTLHEGFVDHTTKTCIFTDHQIYSRYHRCASTGSRARAGRISLSLKELKAIEPGDY